MPILILWFVSEVFFKIKLDNLGKDLVGIQITHGTRCKHVCSATITRRYSPIHTPRTTGTVQSTSTCQTHRLQLPSTARVLCVPHSTSLTPPLKKLCGDTLLTRCRRRMHCTRRRAISSSTRRGDSSGASRRRRSSPCKKSLRRSHARTPWSTCSTSQTAQGRAPRR